MGAAKWQWDAAVPHHSPSRHPGPSILYLMDTVHSLPKGSLCFPSGSKSPPPSIPAFWCAGLPVGLPFTTVSLVSNIAFPLTAVAILKERPLVASLLAVGVMVLEPAWNLGFFAGLFFGIDEFSGDRLHQIRLQYPAVPMTFIAPSRPPSVPASMAGPTTRPRPASPPPILVWGKVKASHGPK